MTLQKRRTGWVEASYAGRCIMVVDDGDLGAMGGGFRRCIHTFEAYLIICVYRSVSAEGFEGNWKRKEA